TLREQLRTYKANVADPLGIYFQYLPSGSYIGIDSDTPFIGASLLKVPIAMATYDLIQQGVVGPDDVIQIEEGDIDKGYGTLWQRGVGTELTLQETVRIMLEESDNTARAMLIRVLS